MAAATDDLRRIHSMIDRGQGPTGRLYLIHGDQDPLANPEATRTLAGRLGDRAQLQMLSSGNHVPEESATEQRHILDGMRWLSSK